MFMYIYYIYETLYICKTMCKTETHSPVVPAGVMFLKYSTTSSLSQRLASFTKDWILFLVSGSGCSREAWSNWRVSVSCLTTCFASQDLDERCSKILLLVANPSSGFPRIKTVAIKPCRHTSVCLKKRRKGKYIYFSLYLLVIWEISDAIMFKTVKDLHPGVIS